MNYQKKYFEYFGICSLQYVHWLVIYAHTHTHTHTQMYIYVDDFIELSFHYFCIHTLKYTNILY